MQFHDQVIKFTLENEVLKHSCVPLLEAYTVATVVT